MKGSAVSASFLFIVGLANSIILFRVIRKRRQVSVFRFRGAISSPQCFLPQTKAQEATL